MKYLLFIAIGFVISSASMAQRAGYWQQKTDYNISVSLNDKTHSLDAFEKIIYTNQSPDTLRFIWFHLWPNAYKNDRTAFSEQLLRNDRTDFYFAADSNKGYINRLDFSATGTRCKTEAHANHIDIIKVLLPQPLPPNSSVTITTPFHVQLPYNFSRGGHIGQDYQITQWYPKPAVYDAKGWHEMPYLDQGEFYSEYGNFEVEITVPANYIVAATGTLQETAELEKLKHAAPQVMVTTPKPVAKRPGFHKKVTKVVNTTPIVPSTPIATKTLHYIQPQVHDFAWFASKDFIVNYDTLGLKNKVVDVFTFYKPSQKAAWGDALAYAKSALRFYSEQVGTYPYATASVVAGSENMNSGGMEYPSITLITTQSKGLALNQVIAHELGHNWFYGALGSNERDHAWMDEAMNSYYDNAYVASKYTMKTNHVQRFFEKRLPDKFELSLWQNNNRLKKAQPIDTLSDAYTSINYGLSVYSYGSEWMQKLSQQLGAATFQKSMQAYYSTWQNKHPYPQDFKESITATSGVKIDSLFNQLYTSNIETHVQKKIKFTTFFSLKNTDSIHYIALAPLVGYNLYDNIMLGGVLHNYQLPLSRFQFLAAPMYATGSKTVNFFGRASYNTFKKKYWLEVGTSISKYSVDAFTPMETSNKLYLGLVKLVPSAKLVLYADDLRSKEKVTLQLRSFLLREEGLVFNTIVTPSGNVDVVSKKAADRYVNQLSVNWGNQRALYPYNVNLTIDQGKNFVRAGITGDAFLNYGSGKGGVDARFFAGKFVYLQSKTFITAYETDRYHLNMSGPKGYEDFTYSDYFIGRNEFEGFHSQQMMRRDGFFKVSTDLLSNKVGKTDDWLMAANFSADVPDNYNPLRVLPIKLPLKVFVDVGTYADAWKDNSADGRFLYDAGLQLSLFNDIINIYVPVLSSKVYRDYNKSVLGENSFMKTITFNFNLRRIKSTLISNFLPL